MNKVPAFPVTLFNRHRQLHAVLAGRCMPCADGRRSEYAGLSRHCQAGSCSTCCPANRRFAGDQCAHGRKTAKTVAEELIKAGAGKEVKVRINGARDDDTIVASAPSPSPPMWTA